MAVALYFWQDWLRLFSKGFTDIKSADGKLFWYLVLATIPGAAIGFLLEEHAETVFRNPILIAFMLVLLGVILYWADRRGAKKTDVSHLTLPTSFLIGLSQALAIIPGVSRSGITMTTALLLGMTREGAARFSFLLSAPIIFGAAAIKMPQIIANPSLITTEFIIGMVVSAAYAGDHRLTRPGEARLSWSGAPTGWASLIPGPPRLLRSWRWSRRRMERGAL